MKKQWYDYLWIASLLYLVLGFFNILFAWLGLLCFFIPLLFAAVGGTLFHPGVAQFAFGFYSVMLTSTVLGLITMVLFKPRSWCVYCPMGTMTQLICKARNGRTPQAPHTTVDSPAAP